MMKKTYEELIKLNSFEERFDYLKTTAMVGTKTFGKNRYLNQKFYLGYAWIQARNKAIIRDNGYNLGVDGYEIIGTIQVHHLNPITTEMIVNNHPDLFDLNNLITVSDNTHKAIHYGTINTVNKPIIDRKENDTTLW